LSHSISPFFWYFQDRVSKTIWPGWLRTSVLLISVSQIARITGVRHQHLACFTLNLKTICFSLFKRFSVLGLKLARQGL
jgi:hypothetical protein